MGIASSEIRLCQAVICHISFSVDTLIRTMLGKFVINSNELNLYPNNNQVEKLCSTGIVAQLIPFECDSPSIFVTAAKIFLLRPVCTLNMMLAEHDPGNFPILRTLSAHDRPPARFLNSA